MTINQRERITTAWIITDGKVGMEVQCVGVAEALGVDYCHKRVSPKGLWRILSPWGPVSPREKMGKTESPFSPPWPDLALATGRLSIPYLRALRRAAGGQTMTVILQDPRTGAGAADLIWVPEHDLLRAENVITTPTAPHAYREERLQALRENPPNYIIKLPHPRISVLLGGPNSVYDFPNRSIEQIKGSIRSLGDLGVSFLITPSRRTPKALLQALVDATGKSPHLIWDGLGQNPYLDFLAHGDMLIVTADSVNMTGEACATGRPVYIFMPEGGSPKFDRFHRALHHYGATRELPQRFSKIESWTYTPLNSAETIAREIEKRWQAR